jgi:N-acetylmuramoyl-L-alanine amidase
VTREPATVEQNKPSTIKVLVTPNHSGQTVALQRLVDGKWQSAQGKTLSSTSRATFTVATSVIGTRTYRVLKRADADHAEGAYHSFRVITIRRTLKAGMTGADVTKVQKRLAYLHYDVGSVNGEFNYDTVHATMAFQKVNRLKVTGEVNATTYGKLWNATVPKLRHPQSGSWVEADLTKQVLYFTRNGAIAKILDISSGSGEYYYVDGETHRAVTPTGSFRVFHKIDGMRTSRLGQLWRPAYFASGGYAIHGSNFVPAWPDSHGCIRITNSAMNRLFSSLPIGIRVYVYRT